MTRALLVTRPNHDLITTYLFHWSALVIKKAKQKGMKVLDLASSKADYNTFKSYIDKHEPSLVFFNGHGNKDVITGQNNEPLVEVNKNEKLLTGKIVYARSCDAAAYLGKKCIKSGTLAFIGYKRKFTLGYSPSKSSNPLKDEIARLFLEPSNIIPISLIKSNTVKDAYRKSQNYLWRNFQFMLSTKATSAQKDAAPYLWANRKYQVVLGDENSRVKLT